MKRGWRVRRAVVEHPDGQRRWDQAYQLLLRWTMAATPSQEEGDDASRVLRARLNGAPTAGADD
jgi:hypothetical protein